MSTEYGIFNDEGLIEADFYNREQAVKALERDYYDDEDAFIAEVEHCEFCCETFPYDDLHTDCEAKEEDDKPSQYTLEEHQEQLFDLRRGR